MKLCRDTHYVGWTALALFVSLRWWNPVQGLASIGRRRASDYVPMNTASELRTSMESSLQKLSPAVAAVQEADVARRILRQRSSRGRPEGHQPIPASAATQLQRQSLLIEQTKKSTSNTKRKISKSMLATSLPYESAVTALNVYHSQHSHLIMPRKYVVQTSDCYPKEWHGVDLAGTVYDMKWWLRHVKQRPDRVAELNELGFVWERLQPEWNLILEALITYRTLNDDLLVPSKFVVPFGDSEWSRSTWGISLGKVVYRIRSRGDFLRGNNSPKRRRQLEALGFVWDVQEHLFDVFCSALHLYARNEVKVNAPRRAGALKVPSQFVVPATKDWPRSLWGYPLGVKCTAVRQKELYIKGNPERMKLLANIGFHTGGNDSLSWLEVVHAAAVYSQMHDRNLDVPQNFVVPAPPRKSESNGVVGSDDAWPWPGMFPSIDDYLRSRNLSNCCVAPLNLKSIFGVFRLVRDYETFVSRGTTSAVNQLAPDDDSWMRSDSIGSQDRDGASRVSESIMLYTSVSLWQFFHHL